MIFPSSYGPNVGSNTPDVPDDVSVDLTIEYSFCNAFNVVFFIENIYFTYNK